MSMLQSFKEALKGYALLIDEMATMITSHLWTAEEENNSH